MENKEYTESYVTGTYVETNERINGDKFLLKTIDDERVERTAADNDIIDSIDDVTERYFIISKQLRKHDIALNFVIGLLVFLLLSMIIIALQVSN